MTILRTSLIALTIYAVAGCATVSPSVPVTYKGPVVRLADTGYIEEVGKGVFFSALAIDGRAIENAPSETRGASFGNGFTLSPIYTSRSVPVKTIKLSIIGTHQTAAPIHEIAARMVGSFFSVEGIVEFKPVEGRTYIVTGELKKERSCVWVSEYETKQPVTEKVCDR